MKKVLIYFPLLIILVLVLSGGYAPDEKVVIIPTTENGTNWTEVVVALAGIGSLIIAGIGLYLKSRRDKWGKKGKND